MVTYRQLIYMVLDELKGSSDDFYYTEEHIAFLLDKYRAFLLKLKYASIKKLISLSNFLTIVLTINNYENIPTTLTIANPIITKPSDNTKFNYCFPNRIDYTGLSRFEKNLLYFTVDKMLDNKVVFKKANLENANNVFSLPHLNSYNITTIFTSSADDIVLEDIEGVEDIILKEDLYMKAIFESPTEVYKFNEEADIMDLVFPLEEGLIPPLLEMTVKDLSSAIFKPEDRVNDGQDNTGNMAHFIAENTKSDLAKQIYG